jgi:hypothetical protein
MPSGAFIEIAGAFMSLDGAGIAVGRCTGRHRGIQPSATRAPERGSIEDGRPFDVDFRKKDNTERPPRATSP